MIREKYLLFFLFISLTAFFPASSFACPSAHEEDPNAYIRRDNNRCEGRDLSANVTSSKLDLISFTIGDFYTTWPSNISLQVRSLSPNSQPIANLIAIGYRYRMDEFELQSNSNSFLFEWPSTVLQQINLPTNRLRVVATTGRSRVYLPSILGQPSSNYQFVFFSTVDTRFFNAEIRNTEDDTVIHQFEDTDFNSGEHFFTWNASNAPAGLYEFRYDIEREYNTGGTEPQSLSNTFEHDPAWLRP